MAELDVLVPFALVPCQYQVLPEGEDGGVPRVSTLCPHWLLTDGVAGSAGTGFTVNDTYEYPLLHKFIDGL